MAQSFSEVLFRTIDAKRAREQAEAERQSSAIERQAEVEFRKEQADRQFALQNEQFTFSREQAAKADELRQQQQRVQAAQLLTQDQFEPVSGMDPSAIDLGGGVYGRPVSAQKQAEVKFERQFQQKAQLLDRFADMASGGDPEEAARIKQSERGVRFMFGDDAIAPNLTTDQAAGQAIRMLYLDPKNGEPRPDLALKTVNEMMRVRALASPNAGLPRQKYEDDIAAEGLAQQILSEIAATKQQSGYRAGFQELYAVGNRLAAAQLTGTDEARRSAITNQAVQLAQRGQGGPVERAEAPDPRTAMRDRMHKQVFLKRFGPEEYRKTFGEEPPPLQ